MRMHEIEDAGDAVGYYGEVFNPFGYVTFALDEDRDFVEKGEHLAVGAFIFSAPFHIGAAISTGGYWANLPPGLHYRMAAAAKFKHDLMVSAGKHAYHASKTAVRGIRAASPWALLAAYATGVAYASYDNFIRYGRDAIPIHMV